MKIKDLIGSKVVLRGDHPWAGHIGIVEKAEMAGIPAKPALKVILDSGNTCYVFSVKDLKTIQE